MTGSFHSLPLVQLCSCCSVLCQDAVWAKQIKATWHHCNENGVVNRIEDEMMALVIKYSQYHWVLLSTWHLISLKSTEPIISGKQRQPAHRQADLLLDAPCQQQGGALSASCDNGGRLNERQRERALLKFTLSLWFCKNLKPKQFLNNSISKYNKYITAIIKLEEKRHDKGESVEDTLPEAATN